MYTYHLCGACLGAAHKKHLPQLKHCLLATKQHLNGIYAFCTNNIFKLYNLNIKNYTCKAVMGNVLINHLYLFKCKIFISLTEYYLTSLKNGHMAYVTWAVSTVAKKRRLMDWILQYGTLWSNQQHYYNNREIYRTQCQTGCINEI